MDWSLLQQPQKSFLLKRELIPLSKKWQPRFFPSPLSIMCVFLPFLFFSFFKKISIPSVSSPEIQIHSASPKMLCQSSPCLLLIARKMIFLPLNHAAALSPSSLNVDSLSIYIPPGPFFSFFIFFSNVDWISLNHSLQVSFPKEDISVDKTSLIQ